MASISHFQGQQRLAKHNTPTTQAKQANKANNTKQPNKQPNNKPSPSLLRLARFLNPLRILLTPCYPFSSTNKHSLLFPFLLFLSLFSLSLSLFALSLSFPPLLSLFFF